MGEDNSISIFYPLFPLLGKVEQNPIETKVVLILFFLGFTARRFLLHFWKKWRKWKKHVYFKST